MASLSLIAGAVVVLGIDVYLLASGESHALGGGTVAAALLLAAAAVGVGRGASSGAERQAEQRASAAPPGE